MPVATSLAESCAEWTARATEAKWRCQFTAVTCIASARDELGSASSCSNKPEHSRNNSIPPEAAASCDPKVASQSAVVAILSGELREVADEAKSEDQLNVSWLSLSEVFFGLHRFSLALYGS